MAIIQVMSNSLANKIAAGEVVERPASVVKELVENSIDAKSSKIDIILEESGIKSIKIIDNGIGMDKEDALLAFMRHATSKLISEQDLFRINTLGFRGEALPSIASISDVHLVTSNGIEAGTYVNYRGGKLINKELAPSRRGTEITVNNLFFNTPARLKYLKSINTELSYTIDYINKIAISHPQIAFKLINNGRVLLQTNGNNNVVNVLASIYGIDVAKKIKYFEYSDQYLKMKLYFSEPDINRTTRNYITLVVNERIIKNNDIIKAVIEGYESYLPINRYPIVVLELTVDPLLVDVNVHPAKLEVRLSNQEHIKSVIISSIKSKLKELMYVPKIIFKKEEQINYVTKKQEEFDFVKQEVKEKTLIDKVVPIETVQENVFNEPVELFEEVVVETKENKKIPKLFYIGQLAGTYLLAQNEEGLYLIDQHAAQERINYEYYLKHLSNNTNEFYELLIPLTFEFSLNESLIIEENIDKIISMNINIEKFGLNSFIVSKIPNWLNRGNEKEVINTIFDFILKNKNINNSTLFNELAVTLSCKRSIKANHYINELEVKKLLSDLELCDNPYTCPHGRPVIIHMSFNEIEHLFKRTM